MRSHLAAYRSALAALLLPVVAVSCGSSDQHRSAGVAGESGVGGSVSSAALGTCGLRSNVSGGTDIDFTGNDDATCTTLHSFDDGLDVIFTGIGAKGSLELLIDSVLEGETGEYPARVVVTSTARENWQGEGCTATLSEHHLLRTEASTLGELRHYQVSAEGSCADPLESVPAGATPVTVGPFAFRAEFTWRD